MTLRGNRVVVPVVGAIALVIGFAVAQLTGNRPLGGAVLVAGAAWCLWAWWRDPGPARALAAVAIFGVAFAVSHPLGRVIGSWPSVVLVALVAAVGAWAIGRTRRTG